jgi:hypothetical protein
MDNVDVIYLKGEALNFTFFEFAVLSLLFFVFLAVRAVVETLESIERRMREISPGSLQERDSESSDIKNAFQEMFRSGQGRPQEPSDSSDFSSEKKVP